MTTEYVLTYEIKESFGWNHIANHYFETREQAERKEAEIRAQYPQDEARFTVREYSW
jgi:hypothetical protein